MTMIQIMYSNTELVAEVMKRGISGAVLAELKKIAIAKVSEKKVEVEKLIVELEGISEKYGEKFILDSDGSYSVTVIPSWTCRRWEPYPVGKWTELRDNELILDYQRNVRPHAEYLVNTISIKLRELAELAEGSGLIADLDTKTRAAYYPAAEGGGGWNRSDASC